LPVGDAWGCESTNAASTHVRAIHTDASGAIQVTAATTGIGPGVDGLFLSLVPVSSANATPAAGTTVFKWVCGNQTAVGSSAFKTTILPKYLPGSCRGN
jgi:type IV pilus assembly protein PilA